MMSEPGLSGLCFISAVIKICQVLPRPRFPLESIYIEEETQLYIGLPFKHRDVLLLKYIKCKQNCSFFIHGLHMY